MLRPALSAAALLLLAGCGETARLAVADGTGPNPEIPEPNQSLIPTVNAAAADQSPTSSRRSSPFEATS